MVEERSVMAFGEQHAVMETGLADNIQRYTEEEFVALVVVAAVAHAAAADGRPDTSWETVLGANVHPEQLHRDGLGRGD